MAAIPYDLASGTGNTQVYTGAGVLMGFSADENAGTPAAATLILHDGTTTGDPVIARLRLAASGDSGLRFLPGGIRFTKGLFVERAAGTIRGTFYIA